MATGFEDASQLVAKLSSVDLDVDKWDWSVLENIDNFEWNLGTTPLANVEVVVGTWIVYLTFIFGLKALRSNSGPIRPRALMGIHNFILTAWSAVMFLGLASAAMDLVETDRTRELFCAFDMSEVKGPFAYWGYIYYLSKFYELLDTVFIVLAQRKLTFLHVFHHCVVIAMTFLWNQQGCMLGLVMGALFNTFVHVWMYLYYAFASFGIRLPYARMLTSLQIIQFVSSFLLAIPYLGYDNTNGVWEAGKSACTGWVAFSFSAVCNSIFLVLFINFYRQAYTRRSRIKQA